MVTLILQGYFFDEDNSIGEQASRLEAKWPGILIAAVQDTSKSGNAEQGRPFIDYVPISTWPLTYTQVSFRTFIVLSSITYPL